MTRVRVARRAPVTAVLHRLRRRYVYVEAWSNGMMTASVPGKKVAV